MELAHHFKKAAAHHRRMAAVHDDMSTVHGDHIDSHDSPHKELQGHHTKLANLHRAHAEHLAELAEADKAKVGGDELSLEDREFLRKLVGIDDLNG